MMLVVLLAAVLSLGRALYFPRVRREVMGDKFFQNGDIQQPDAIEICERLDMRLPLFTDEQSLESARRLAWALAGEGEVFFWTGWFEHSSTQTSDRFGSSSVQLKPTGQCMLYGKTSGHEFNFYEHDCHHHTFAYYVLCETENPYLECLHSLPKMECIYSRELVTVKTARNVCKAKKAVLPSPVFWSAMWDRVLRLQRHGDLGRGWTRRGQKYWTDWTALEIEGSTFDTVKNGKGDTLTQFTDLIVAHNDKKCVVVEDEEVLCDSETEWPLAMDMEEKLLDYGSQADLNYFLCLKWHEDGKGPEGNQEVLNFLTGNGGGMGMAT